MTPRQTLLGALMRHAQLRADDPVVKTFLRFVTSEPRALDRELRAGHVTASAWVADPGVGAAVLVHHPKLDRWLQPGGHLEPGELTPDGSLREAREETGLTELRLASDAIFDLDAHLIPARGDEPEHWHYDVRHLVWASAAEDPRPRHEVRRAAWVPYSEIARLTTAESVLRLARLAASARAPEIP